MKRLHHQLKSQQLSQNRTPLVWAFLLKQITILTLTSTVFAGAGAKYNSSSDQFIDLASLPYLRKAEVQKMQLLRLWHTRPVVEGFVVGADLFKNDSSSLDLNYLPEQIQGRNAKFYSNRASDVVHAKDVACQDDLKIAQKRFENKSDKNYKSDVYDTLSGVVRMGGRTYAKSYEPMVDRQNSNRYQYMTSMQAGQNFSFGGWIRFARPAIERYVYEWPGNFGTDPSRYKLRMLVPDYYTFLGKAPDQFDNLTDYKFNQKNRRLGEYVRKMKPEWQFYMTGETLYLGSFQGKDPHNYYTPNTAENNKAIANYSQYQACLKRQSEARVPEQTPAQPLARALKPVPPPVDIKPPVVNPEPPPENCTPYPIVIPPVAGGIDKKHIVDFDIRTFKQAETWSSSYIKTKKDNDGVHYEAWHFLNVSFNLVDPFRPTINVSIISLPYLDHLSKDEANNTLSRCLSKVKISGLNKTEMLPGDQCRYDEIEIPIDSSASSLAQFLMNETDSPVTIGTGFLYAGSESSAEMADRIYRSGTYIAREALNKNQVLRLAQVLYPSAAASCRAKDLKPIFPSRTDFASEY